VAAFAVALAVAGLVALTLLFAQAATYADIAVREDLARQPFRAPGWPDPAYGGGTETVRYPLGTLVDLHRRTLAYVLGEAAALPGSPTRGDLYSPQERSHLADVRGVFVASRVAMAAATLAALALALRAWRDGALARLLRAGALAAAAGVTLLAAAAGVAFDPLFLLFHEVFFPQGNFLFAPGSNLLALYPEEYFYAVTLRIGAGFVAGSLALAGVAHVSLRRGGASA
jgi:hypothetical protein